MFKEFFKSIIPIFLLKNINKFFKRDIRFIGPYKNWKDAANNSTGYSSDIIFNKKKKSFLRVIANNAKYERDSVLFFSELINYPLINLLNKLQKNKKTCLNVLDFGGSFGSTYFQNYSILKNKNKFDWAIIEQPKIVKFMKKFKLEDNLKFYLSIRNYMEKHRPDIVLFSGVIQYLRYPYKIINYFIKKKVKNIFFIKTPFSDNNEKIMIQIVPKYIYDASYPIRIFNESRFLKVFIDNNYKKISNFCSKEIIGDILFKNFIFKLGNSKTDDVK